MISIPALLTLLAQLSGCVSNVCTFSVEREFPLRRLPISLRDVIDVVPLSDEEFLVASSTLTPVGAVNVTRVGASGEEAIASTPPLIPSGNGPNVIAARGHWWFSRIGDEGTRESVFFAESGDEIRESRIDVVRRTNVWLPLQDDKPRGIRIAMSEGDSALVVDEVTPSGVKHLAEFPWRQFNRILGQGLWSAEALPDGRVAIVSVDDPPEDGALKLRIVGGGEPIERTLPCPVMVDKTIGTAVDDAGTIAIVARTDKGEIVAMIVAADKPEAAQCRVISAPGEVAARVPFTSPSMIAAGDRFVAAWIRDDRTIRACELTGDGLPSLAIDIGHDADVPIPLRQLVHADGEQVTFIWRDRGGDIMERRMPEDLRSTALFLALQSLLCETAEGVNGKLDLKVGAGESAVGAD